MARETDLVSIKEALVERAEETLLAAVLLLQLGKFGGGRFQLGLSGLEGSLLRGEVAGHDEGFRDQIADPAFVLGLAFLVLLQDPGSLRHPPVGRD